MSDSDHGTVLSEAPEVEPYEVLGLGREATTDQIKSAYRKAALKNHPDKVPDEQKAAAHERFQLIALAYAVLSDPTRRRRYDATGSTAESMVDAHDFDWSTFYREQFKDTVSADAIKKFAKTYKGSDEEKDDVLAVYEEFLGDLDQVYERVMLSHAIDDDVRFRHMIDEAIKEGGVTAFPAYTKESKNKRRARVRGMRAEEAEAEGYAQELGIHDKLFGRTTKQGPEASSEDSLTALIRKRQQDRSASYLAYLADKYRAPDIKANKSKKRRVEEEPSEEAFQEAAARLKQGTRGSDRSGATTGAKPKRLSK